MDTPPVGMTANLDIEQPDELRAYLRERGETVSAEVPAISRLDGGVSNRTMLVQWPDGRAWVLKQALPRLRVATDWFSDVQRNHREALGLEWLARLAPPGTITPLVFEDQQHHVLAMEAVPPPHENWKNRLLATGPDAEHVRQFGQLLGTIHARSAQRRDELLPLFQDRTCFETLRIEPYYRFTATRHPAAAGFLQELIGDTFASVVALVHGDYSPKNVLLHAGRLVLLDHEVIHFGDPAFDVGFSLTHLLGKANHLPERQPAFVAAAREYWRAYRSAAGELATLDGGEARAVRHTLACLLARVDGRSPLEYLAESGRARQRKAALRLMSFPPALIPELIEQFAAGLAHS